MFSLLIFALLVPKLRLAMQIYNVKRMLFLIRRMHSQAELEMRGFRK